MCCFLSTWSLPGGVLVSEPLRKTPCVVDCARPKGVLMASTLRYELFWAIEAAPVKQFFWHTYIKGILSGESHVDSRRDARSPLCRSYSNNEEDAIWRDKRSFYLIDIYILHSTGIPMRDPPPSSVPYRSARIPRVLCSLHDLIVFARFEHLPAPFIFRELMDVKSA